MARLNVSVTTMAPLDRPLPAEPLLTVDYTRIVSTRSEGAGEPADEVEGGDQLQTAPGQAVATVSTTLAANLVVDDYVEKSPVEVTLSNASGSALLTIGDQMPRRNPGREPEFTLAVSLTAPQAASVQVSFEPSPQPPARRLVRTGRFVPVGFPTPRFRSMTLLVAPVREQDLPKELLRDIFGTEAFAPAGRRLPDEHLARLASLPITEIAAVGVELTGRFHVDLSVDHIAETESAGWLWLLSGDDTFVGLQPESDLAGSRGEVPILLPAPAGGLGGTPSQPVTDTPSPVPADPTEDELLSDPDLFSDDPGSACRPFSNRGRIVSEHSFHTVLRVEQPTIGGRQSVPPPDRIAPYSPVFPIYNMVMATVSESTGSGDDVGREPIDRRGAAARNRRSLAQTAKIATIAVAEERRGWTELKSRGRYVLSGDEPLDWEGDSYPYQASSLAFGHILEHRVRERSNGLSVGKVKGTIPLAPRQTKRIVTVTSTVVDSASRTESTVARDDVEQSTTRSYGYQDQVSASLREWSKGGSDASTSGAAGGAAFAVPGFVIGGGAAHGESHSSSWSRGGRDVAAQETQSLTDALRSYGDSMRSLDSVVVREETQSETSQAVSEVLRNANYGHSLTVIYHEILRHVRVDTELVGARECVFVPFALGPFTYERAWRWRDTLQSGLRRRRLGSVLAHFGELDEFGRYIGADIPQGARAEHPVNHVRGSLTIRLGIERPPDDSATDAADAAANAVLEQQILAQWRVIGPFMPMSVQAARALLRRPETDPDATFQREVAPGIAARWVDSLELVDGSGNPLTGSLDFSLASNYGFGSTVRVNFTYRPPTPTALRRKDLVDLTVLPTKSLTKGSVATLERVDYHYFTDNFDYEVSSDRASNDLISPATGEPDGALVHTALDLFENRDLRRELEDSAAELLSHLNEHSEYYHKLILWRMDRDKLFMMLDSLQLRPNDTRSVASVVEKEPVAIVGNSLVYAVAGGAHIKVDGHATPDALHHHYVDPNSRPEPIRVSLPTSGLYAQTIMDECDALEEHLGSTDWILSDVEPELAGITPEMLVSRRATTPALSPTEFGAPIINLQSAATPPAPQGFGDLLGALQNANAFRDMAGLAKTQDNAMGAFTGAAELASSFAAKAVELRKAEMAAQTANEKLNVIKKAKTEGLTDETAAKINADRVLGEMTDVEDTSVSAAELEKIAETADDRQVDVEVDKPLGKAKVTPKRKKRPAPNPATVTKDFRFTFFGLNSRLLEATWGIRIGPRGQADFNDVSSDESEIRMDGVDFDPSEGMFISVFSNGNTQSSSVLSPTSQFYFTAHKRFGVPTGRKVFVNVRLESTEVKHESSVQLSRADVLSTVFGENVKLKVSAEILGGILGGGIETGLEFQETRTASAGSSTGEVFNYTIEVPTGGLILEVQEL